MTKKSGRKYLPLVLQFRLSSAMANVHYNTYTAKLSPHAQVRLAFGFIK
jgi:hypothetical protein